MPFLLVAAFVIVPIVELAVIGQVSGWLGLPLTLLILLVDSVVGAVLVRREGRRAWTAFRTALAESRWPGDEVAQGALVLVGGALLLTPGFVTDAVGLACVLPPTRLLLSRAIRARLTPGPVKVIGSVFGGEHSGASPGASGGGPRRGAGTGSASDPAIDVEVVSVEREDRDEPGGHGPEAGRG